MAKILGIIVVFASVLGGYILSHGKLAALIQPFEVMIIGGAALGAFLQANPGNMTMIVFKKSLKMFGTRFNQAFYLDVLRLLYEILNKSRREGMMAIEGDIEDPAASPIFAKYPAVLGDERMTAFICDYLRIMSTGNMAPHELEGLFDMELLNMKEELEHPSHAVTGIADGMPGFGIVAAVLGIVVTMASLGDGDQQQPVAGGRCADADRTGHGPDRHSPGGLIPVSRETPQHGFAPVSRETFWCLGTRGVSLRLSSCSRFSSRCCSPNRLM